MAQWHGQVSRVAIVAQSMGAGNSWPGKLSDFVSSNGLGNIPGRLSDYVRAAGVNPPTRLSQVPGKNRVKTDVIVNGFGTYPYNSHNRFYYTFAHTPIQGADRIWISVYAYPLNRGSHQGVDQGATSGTGVLRIKAPTGTRTYTAFSAINGWNQVIHRAEYSFSLAELGLSQGATLNCEFELYMGSENYHDGGAINECMLGSAGPGVGVYSSNIQAGMTGQQDRITAKTYMCRTPRTSPGTGPSEYPWSSVVDYTQYSRSMSRSSTIYVDIDSTNDSFDPGTHLHPKMLAAAGGSWPGNDAVWVVRVAPGVRIVAANTSVPCLSFVGAIRGKIILQNWGTVLGRGGKGGDSNGNGNGGYHAIYRESHITLEIQNYGVIAGGGGGGAAGRNTGNGGSGGGGGAPYGGGGSGRNSYTVGGAASVDSPGAGGPQDANQRGFDGGSWGNKGNDGSHTYGGPAGYAIAGGGPIIWTARGDLRGPVS